jgi:hemerythrin-like domain-containing protein
MNLIVEQLNEDHRQLVRILYHLEREVKAFGGLTKVASNLESILDILDYIQVYPEIWHHPTEDVIYEALLEKDIPDLKQLADTLEEHATLELLTENLQEYINLIAADRGVSVVRFIKSTHDYINRQLQHMEKEQKYLFPLMEQYLDQQDWKKIKQRLKGLQCLLEEPRLQKYQAFYKGLANTNLVTAH